MLIVGSTKQILKNGICEKSIREQGTASNSMYDSVVSAKPNSTDSFAQR
jgi:hypothetical protein